MIHLHRYVKKTLRKPIVSNDRVYPSSSLSGYCNETRALCRSLWATKEAYKKPHAFKGKRARRKEAAAIRQANQQVAQHRPHTGANDWRRRPTPW